MTRRLFFTIGYQHGNLLLRASTPAYRMMGDTNDSDSEPQMLAPTLGAGRRFPVPLASPDE